ncbi:MAG: FG-GAP repeat protein, partial [Phycisphaerales bacterium]|nr:FG-GAP repeat protein [Phycisphaerales bacterium]
MKIVQYVALAVLAMIPLSAISGPVESPPMYIVTTVAMGGPSSSVPTSAFAKITMGGPSNTAPLSAITHASMGGPAGTTVASVISRAVLGGPIEDLIRAVIAASGAFNEWSLEQSWSDGYAGNHFGSSVAIDGDWMLIGSSGSSDNNGSGGTVRLYEYDGVDWSVINSWSDGYAGNHFGSSVAL